MDKLLTSEEAAEYLRVNKHTLFNLVNRGSITPFRIANGYRFTMEMLEDYLRKTMKEVN